MVKNYKFQIIGILNITPDSYHDGGKYTKLDSALNHAEKMLQEGADIIDIGGESTFVDRESVNAEEELQRVIPVIEALKKEFPECKLSIDTYKAPVALAAIEAGAMMVNDVTAGRGDPTMFDTLKDQDALLVLMFAKDETSRTTTEERKYENVMADIKEFLRERKTSALSSGIREENIILDPGLGFFLSSIPTYSMQVIARLPELQELGSPLYLSPSRKSFLSGIEKLPPSDRLPGTLAAAAIAVLNGASYIRTHDVQETRRACEIAEAIRNA